MKKLLMQASVKFLVGLLTVGALVFLPAGTFRYFRGWLFMGVLFVPIFFVGIVLLFKNPELLKKRLNGRERQGEQKTVLFLSGLMFVAGFLLSGFGVRFDWYVTPVWSSYIACLVFLFGYVLFAEVMRENTYLSRTVEVQAGQKVIDTGLYGIVRHPMYSATLFMFMSMPLVLGSLYSFAVFLIYPFIIAKRIMAEEKLLEKELAGYCDYKKKVKYRLLPFIW